MDVADTTLNVEQQILRRERLAAIRRHVDALPERQRLAVIMHKYQSMDYKEIAGASAPERIGNQIITVSRIRDIARKTEGLYLGAVMNCKDVREQLLERAVEGGAAPAELELHFAGCAPCAREFEQMNKTMALLDEWQAPEPSPYFDVRLEDACAKNSKRAPFLALLAAQAGGGRHCCHHSAGPRRGLIPGNAGYFEARCSRGGQGNGGQ